LTFDPGDGDNWSTVPFIAMYLNTCKYCKYKHTRQTANEDRCKWTKRNSEHWIGIPEDN